MRRSNSRMSSSASRHRPDLIRRKLRVVWHFSWLWNGGRVAQAEGELAAERMRLEADSREIEATTLAARAASTQAYEAARRYRERILPRAERIAEFADRSFRLGEVTLLEVIDARRTLGESKRDYLELLLRARLEFGRLAILLGKDGIEL